jgi:hypothetical protein
MNNDNALNLATTPAAVIDARAHAAQHRAHAGAHDAWACASART